MKTDKTLFSIIFLLTIASTMSNFSYAQAIKENNVVISPSIGIPNVRMLTIPNYEQPEGILHYGLSLEYAANKRIGFGLEALYSPIRRFAEQQNAIYHGYSNWFEEDYKSFEFREDRIRVFADVFVHFLLKSEKWNLFLSAGVGVNYTSKTAFVNGEKVPYNSVVQKDELNDLPDIPVAARISFGARYFITNYFGISMQAGIGGPLLATGLVFKF